MKRRLIVLAMLVCLVALSISAAAEGSLSERREYVQNCLQQAYTFFGEKDAADMEELEAALDIPMTEEIVYSSACIGNTVYILARYGIFAIETEGSYTYYPFDGDKTTRQDFPIEIFTVDGELHALMYCKEEPQDRNWSSMWYGSIEFVGNHVLLERQVEVDLSIYEKVRQGNSGREIGGQHLPIVYDGKLCSLDYTQDAEKCNYVQFDLTTGLGKDLGPLWSVYDFVPYKDGQMLGICNYAAHLLEGVGELSYPVPGDMGKTLLSKPLFVLDAVTGKWEIVHYFDMGLAGIYNGYQSGFSYDQKQDRLYYTASGKLHRVEGLDFATDTIIGDAPGNWLLSSSCNTRSYITEDRHYVHIVPYAGVDIIDLSAIDS